MEILGQFIDILIHLDVHVEQLVSQYGPWIYAILFAVIFAETGFVVTPILPGDSLIFVAGAVAALGGMDATLLMALLLLAAVLGNSLNYAIGRWLGPRVFQWPDSRFFNRNALDKTREFYERHGGKAVVISRFLPLFRTFVPFVAGIGAMDWRRFSLFNITGGALWVVSLTAAGYWFGNMPLIKNNLTLVILSIIGISFLPAFIGWWRHRRAAS
ncbi:MAG: DedA family protein [Proteobacteria bacterium]|nr:DedA family protein [Pseudomonadota bacterium]HQR03692.1 DedA family protein [Rhodocyclaceae bacterium]